MRGYIYEVTSNIDMFGLFSLTESDLYDECGALSVDYVLDVEKEQMVELRDDLLGFFAKLGANVTKVSAEGTAADETESETDGDAEMIDCVEFSDDFKRNYFRKSFESARKLINEMDLDVFAGINYKSNMLYNLISSISDNYGDMVYFNASCYTMDDFIRSVEPGKKYFFGNIVLLH